MLTKIYYTLWFPISKSFTFIRKLKGEIFHLSSEKKTCSENDGHKLLMEPHPLSVLQTPVLADYHELAQPPVHIDSKKICCLQGKNRYHIAYCCK